jgi:hypothetical protein
MIVPDASRRVYCDTRSRLDQTTIENRAPVIAFHVIIGEV